MFDLPGEYTEPSTNKVITTGGAFSNCASGLEKPKMDRGESKFVGLHNQYD